MMDEVMECMVGQPTSPQNRMQDPHKRVLQPPPAADPENNKLCCVGLRLRLWLNKHIAIPCFITHCL